MLTVIETITTIASPDCVKMNYIIIIIIIYYDINGMKSQKYKSQNIIQKNVRPSINRDEMLNNIEKNVSTDVFYKSIAKAFSFLKKQKSTE